MTNTTYVSRGQNGIDALEDEIKKLQEGAVQDVVDQEKEIDMLVKEVQDAPLEKPENAPLTKEEETFKKRYGDLRRHAQEKERELKQRIEALEKGVTNTGVVPKTPEEVKAWMAKYPDVAGIVMAIVEEKNGGSGDIDARLRRVEEKEEQLRKEEGLAQLRKLHPDFDDLVSENSALHDWAKDQPDWLQSILYDGEDPKSVGRVLNMYKVEAGITKASQPDNRKAASAVTSPNGAKPSENSSKRVFRESEIDQMSAEEFGSLEKEILVAQREGRVVRDLAKRAAY